MLTLARLEGETIILYIEGMEPIKSMAHIISNEASDEVVI